MFFPFGMIAAGIGVDLSGPWSRARSRSGIKQDALAALMKFPTHHQLSAAIEGRSHLSFQRLVLLLRDPEGRQFVRYFIQEVAEAEGLDLDVLYDLARVERLATRLIDRMQKRVPVKAGMREQRREQAS